MADGNASQKRNSSDTLLGGLAEVLEAVLDKGAVIGGDIKVDKNDAESLPIKLRLIATSVGEAKEIGMDWWANDPFLSPKAAEKKQSKLEEEKSNKETQNTNSPGSHISEKDIGYASENIDQHTGNEEIEKNDREHKDAKEENQILETRLQTLEEKMDKIIEMNTTREEAQGRQTVTAEEKNEQATEKGAAKKEDSPKNKKKNNQGKSNMKNQEIQ